MLRDILKLTLRFYATRLLLVRKPWYIDEVGAILSRVSAENARACVNAPHPH